MLDNTFEKAKDVFDVVSDTAEKVITVQKQKYKLASAKNELKKDYARLGKLYYEYLKKGNLDDVKINSIEKLIDIQLSNIRDIQNQLADATNKFVCPYCSQHINSNSKFCNYCGKQIVFTEE